MLYLLISMVVLLAVFAGWGSVVQGTCGKLLDGLSGKILTGMALVATISTLVAFLLPLNLYFEITILLLGLAAFFYFKVNIDFSEFFLTKQYTFYILAAVTLFFGSGYPFILDHFGYYVPTIKWISEIGLVQGISNVDLLLGQMSVWHVLQAAFSHLADPFLRVNVLVLLTYLIYIFEKKSWIHLVFLPVLFLFSQSPSPDLPAITFSLIILNEFMRGNKNFGWLFFFSAMAFVMKPTLLWLPMFSIGYIVLIGKTNVKVLLPGSAIVLLFIFKNIWTFGYPVFPVDFPDLGFSWRPHAELLRNSSVVAIERTYDMQFAASQISNFSYFEYIYYWLFIPGIKGMINLCFVLSLTAFLFFAIKKNSKVVWLLFTAVLIKSVLVLMFSAQYRFYLDVFFVVFFIIFYDLITRRISLTVFTAMSVLIAIFLYYPHFIKTVLPSFRLGSVIMGFKTSQLIEPAHFNLEKYNTYHLGNLKFNVVQGYPYSFDTPLPAIVPAYIQEDLDAAIFPQLKGKTIQEGFIWRWISDEEKVILKQILEDFNRSQEKDPEQHKPSL